MSDDATLTMPLGPLPNLIHRFEQLSPDNVEALSACYAPDAHFKDPFNDVRGRDAIAHVFRHMFQQVIEPRFTVLERFGGEDGPDSVMLRWRFDFRLRQAGPQESIEGMSLLRFDAAGLVCEHRDFWDAASELYTRLPVLGTLMRWLQRRMSAQT